jgi:cobalamin synthesis protein cobW-like protein
VQHTLYPPHWFDSWPDEDRRSRLVFIVRDIPTETLLERFRTGDPVSAGTINTTGERIMLYLRYPVATCVLPGGTAKVDIGVADGKIAAIGASGTWVLRRVLSMRLAWW